MSPCWFYGDNVTSFKNTKCLTKKIHEEFQFKRASARKFQKSRLIFGIYQLMLVLW